MKVGVRLVVLLAALVAVAPAVTYAAITTEAFREEWREQLLALGLFALLLQGVPFFILAGFVQSVGVRATYASLPPMVAIEAVLGIAVLAADGPLAGLWLLLAMPIVSSIPFIVAGVAFRDSRNDRFANPS